MTGSLDSLAQFDPHPLGIRADGKPVILPPAFHLNQRVRLVTEDAYDGCVGVVVATHLTRPFTYWVQLAGEPTLTFALGTDQIEPWEPSDAGSGHHRPK